MKFAGFTAEASLYRSATRFGRSPTSKPGSGSVAPCQAYCFPNGTYEQSCTVCYYDGNAQFVCTCLNEQGAGVISSLDVLSCNADVANCNGQLTCGGC